MTKLNHVFKLYVPSTVAVDQVASAADQQSLVDSALDYFSRLFGGATAQPATGAWLSRSSGLVKEAITLVYAYTDDGGKRDHEKDVFAYAARLASRLGQEAVAVEADGTLSLVEAADAAALAA